MCVGAGRCGGERVFAGRVEGAGGDDAGGQDTLLTGTAFAAVEAAGNTAHCVHLLLEVNRQGEEVDAVTGTGSHGHGDHDGSLTIGDHSGAGSQLSHLAHLDGQGTAAQIHGPLLVVGELLVLDDGRHCVTLLFSLVRRSFYYLALEYEFPLSHRPWRRQLPQRRNL